MCHQARRAQYTLTTNATAVRRLLVAIIEALHQHLGALKRCLCASSSAPVLPTVCKSPPHIVVAAGNGWH